MDGWWCVRFGDALAWVEAPTLACAVRRSLDLHPLGDRTDDVRNLRAFPQDAYPDHSSPHDYTRAVLTAGPPARRRSPYHAVMDVQEKEEKSDRRVRALLVTETSLPSDLVQIAKRLDVPHLQTPMIPVVGRRAASL